MVDLYLWFPEDFDERHEEFKSKLLSIASRSQVEEGKKFPHKLPSGTRWENFIINFKSDNRVLVSVREFSQELSYEEMGFADKRNGKPDSQWALLLILAKHNGELAWSMSEAKGKFKKVKERLTNRLQEYFDIAYDPFYSYLETKSYRVVMTLIPPPTQNIPTREDLDAELEAYRNVLEQEL